ncbi:MAG: undecaprenyldiphospho-muramoylpentapeptide beta-N-acetylglucosaminyltransferase [Oscillospiraceae bacterium]|nr:undecaprenyldiphospho-muramoylpentapeptide beta-N-acetylglucosaminyltransferase [Oscillospiraceae bacterium]
MKVVIAAAGTGGHINPALAIANKIKKEDAEAQIIFIGTSYGLENDLVPRGGYPLRTITAYGLSKKISVENFKHILGTIGGIGQARRILKDFKPDIVIGAGGYICGPVFLAAKMLKIPTMIHESNAFPGKAVKSLLRWTDVVLVGFEDTKKSLGNAKNIVVTGNPTRVERMDLSLMQKEEILSQLGLKIELPVVLVFGGSQGAKAINDSLIGIIDNRLQEQYQIVWAAGPKQYDIIKDELALRNVSIENVYNMRIVPYIYNMDEVMNVADLVIARSGAMTITEVAKVGKPAIFIPLPNVSQNHQEYNARVLANVGAAEIIQNSELNESILSNSIKKIILHRDRMMSMGEAARTVAPSNVEEKIYNEIVYLVGKK